VRRLGSAGLAAADPSASFVAAARAAHPDVDIREASAEQLPWPDDAFDLALAQLVVHFMSDAVAGLREMARVTRPDGLVAANVWDYGGDRSPLSPFWAAVREIDTAHPGEADLAGAVDGALVTLFEAAELRDVRQHELTVHVPLSGFDEYWAPFELGVGPAGSYVRGLDSAAKADLRLRVAAALPDGAFEMHATAWAATGRP
jgi:SAM-dependent methyltransferase